MWEPCPRGSAPTAVFMRKNFSNFLSCRHIPLVIVRGFAAVRGWKIWGRLRREFSCRATKAPDSHLLSNSLSGLWSCTSASTPGGGAGQPRSTLSPSCSRWPWDRQSNLNVSYKCRVWFVFWNDILRCVIAVVLVQ